MAKSATRPPSGVVTLPRWLQSAPKVNANGRVYVTNAGLQWHPGAVAVALAWCIREHDSAEELRKLAHRLAEVAVAEYRPSLKRLERAEDDRAVWNAALRIINEVCRRWNIDPETPFMRNPPSPPPIEPPRCHMKPMKLAGYHQHKHWKCQHCSHTKKLEGTYGHQ